MIGNGADGAPGTGRAGRARRAAGGVMAATAVGAAGARLDSTARADATGAPVDRQRCRRGAGNRASRAGPAGCWWGNGGNGGRMHPHTPGPVQCGQRGNHRRRGVTPIGWPHHAVGRPQRTEEALARSTHQHWDAPAHPRPRAVRPARKSPPSRCHAHRLAASRRRPPSSGGPSPTRIKADILEHGVGLGAACSPSADGDEALDASCCWWSDPIPAAQQWRAIADENQGRHSGTRGRTRRGVFTQR